MPNVRSLGMKSLKSVWSRTWNRRSNSSSSEASWNPSANRAFRGSSRVAWGRPTSPGRPRWEGATRRLAGLRRGLRVGGGTRLAQPALELAVAILQLAVTPGRLLAVALELLEQAGVHLFDPPEPLFERARLGQIRWGASGCLAVREATGSGPHGQDGEPGAEVRADPKAGGRLAHPTPSWETGRAKRPYCGSFHLLKYRRGGLGFIEKARGSICLRMRMTARPDAST